MAVNANTQTVSAQSEEKQNMQESQTMPPQRPSVWHSAPRFGTPLASFLSALHGAPQGRRVALGARV